jgi:hypothetical protein
MMPQYVGNMGKHKNNLQGQVWWDMPVIPAALEVKTGRSQFRNSPGKKKSVRPCLKSRPDVLVHACNPRQKQKDYGMRPAKEYKMLSQIILRIGCGSSDRVLPISWEALSSSLSAAKKKKIFMIFF